MFTTKNSIFKRLISFTMCICLVILFYSPNIQAKDLYLNNLYQISLQRTNGIEIINLPSDLSKSEIFKLKNNILLHGDEYLTQNEIEYIKQNAEEKGGLVYGSWFGGFDKYYSMSIKEQINFFNGIATFIGLFIADSKAIVSFTTSIISLLNNEYILPESFSEGEWIKANCRKRYREVSYSDGTFAYFETGIFLNNLSAADNNYGSPKAILSGGLY